MDGFCFVCFFESKKVLWLSALSVFFVCSGLLLPACTVVCCTLLDMYHFDVFQSTTMRVNKLTWSKEVFFCLSYVYVTLVFLLDV